MEHFLQLLQIFGGDCLLAIFYRVDGTGSIKQMGDNDRRVQVVVQCIVALLAKVFHIHCRSVRSGQLLQMVVSVHQTAQSLFGSLQRFVAEVHRAAIMSLQDKETDRHGRISLA